MGDGKCKRVSFQDESNDEARTCGLRRNRAGGLLRGKIIFLRRYRALREANNLTSRGHLIGLKCETSRANRINDSSLWRYFYFYSNVNSQPAFHRATKSQSQIHLSRRQLATGRIESARQIVGRVNKAKGGEKAEMDRARKRKSRFWKEEEEEG